MVITGDNPEPFTIRRKSSSGSESEADALKKILETIESKKRHWDVFNPFAKDFVKQFKFIDKKSGNQRFKALRGNKKKIIDKGFSTQSNYCKECGYGPLESESFECPRCGIEF